MKKTVYDGNQHMLLFWCIRLFVRYLPKIAYHSIFWPLYHYSGLAFIVAKATSNKNEDDHPTLVLWLASIYLAAFGLASQKYENHLDRFENEMNLNVALMGSFAKEESLQFLVNMLDDKLPTEPILLNPYSIFSSLTMEGKSIHGEQLEKLLETVETLLVNRECSDRFDEFRTLTLFESGYPTLLKRVLMRIIEDSDLTLEKSIARRRIFRGNRIHRIGLYSDCPSITIDERYLRQMTLESFLGLQVVKAESLSKNFHSSELFLSNILLRDTENSKGTYSWSGNSYFLSSIYIDGVSVFHDDVNFILSSISKDLFSRRALGFEQNLSYSFHGINLFFSEIDVPVPCEIIRSNSSNLWTVRDYACGDWPAYKTYDELLEAYLKVHGDNFFDDSKEDRMLRQKLAELGFDV